MLIASVLPLALPAGAGHGPVQATANATDIATSTTIKTFSVDTFADLVRSYGILETLAGNGTGRQDAVNYWHAGYEGTPGAQAALSRPHAAMADQARNVYIADKNSHAILKLTPAGLITTHAGTHVNAFDGNGPAAATSISLAAPTGLWVKPDGTVYVLDNGNGRVRRVGTHGIMTTLFLATKDGSALDGGRGLWVRDDESLAYFCEECRLRRWTPAAGVQTVASGFSELGTLYVESSGEIILCDRGAHRVFRVLPNGTRTILAGNGTTTGGGDGSPALSTGLAGVRGVWAVPTGGYLLLIHDGCQLWYLDPDNVLHLMLNGASGPVHDGDGEFFYAPWTPKIGEGRSVTIDLDDNIIICESDYGYVRRIRSNRAFSPAPTMPRRVLRQSSAAPAPDTAERITSAADARTSRPQCTSTKRSNQGENRAPN
jgi:hypothetical protein